MAAPTGSVTFDKATYAPGTKVTATVTYADPDTRSFTFSSEAKDAAGETARIQGSFSVADTVTVGTPTDDGSHVWTKVSDDGQRAIFTTTA